jgi:hypothetical protein
MLLLLDDDCLACAYGVSTKNQTLQYGMGVVFHQHAVYPGIPLLFVCSRCDDCVSLKFLPVDRALYIQVD